MRKRELQKAIRVESCRCVCEEGRFKLELKLVNRAADPLFFCTRVRCVELDSASKELHLWFCDRRIASCEEDAQLGVSRCFSMPTAEPIEGESAKTIAVEMPALMTRMRVDRHGKLSFEGLDLSEATQVRLHLAFDDKPIYLDPSADPREQARAWGQDFEASAQLEAA